MLVLRPIVRMWLVTLSPVLHVNADDAESVVHAMQFALDFRMQFGRDVSTY
jgi:2-oxoglutarate dehydrogenase E1 component